MDAHENMSQQRERAENYQLYQSLDEWFASHGLSYQVHWTVREVVFHSELEGSEPQALKILKDTVPVPRTSIYIENIDGRRHLTVRLPLAEPPRHRYGLHLALFVITFLTTVSCGAIYIGHPGVILHYGISGISSQMAGQPNSDWYTFLYLLSNGLCFSIPFLLILTCHEFGHFFASRKYGLSATLPFYIPAPIGIGTFGAMIALRSPMVHRRCVFDVGAAGPLAGFVVALPVFWYGLTISPIDQFANHPGATYIEEGKSLLYLGMLWLTKGPLPSTHFVNLHHIAWAGWFGLFITALNLVPIGQLDGGHISYAMFGRGHERIAKLFFAMLVLMIPFWHSYILFVFLLFFLIRLKHPPAVEELIELDPVRYWLGWLCFLIFFLTFVPIPLEFVTG